MRKVYRDREWLEDVLPVDGELVRDYDIAGGYAQSLFIGGVEKTNDKIEVVSHSNRVSAMVGESFSVTLEFRGSDDNIKPINDTFGVPIQTLDGVIVKTIAMEFVDGVCTREISFDTSGEYTVTKQLINMHLVDKEIDFNGFNISILE